MNAYLEDPRFNIDQPSCRHALLLHVIINHRKRPFKLLASFNKRLTPAGHGTVVRDTSVIALHNWHAFEAFDPASGLACAKCLLKQTVPVLNAAY